MHKTLIALALLGLAQAAQASGPSILAQWNFNSNPPDGSTSTGTTLPNIGSGTASLVGGVTASFASGDASGGSTDPATGDDSGWQTTTYAAQGTENKQRGVQFAVSTLGWKDITVSWDQRHSNTAARHVQFQYSTDGTTFTDFGTLFEGNAGDTWFNGRSVDLSGVTGVDNNDKFAFRIVAAFAPNTTTYLASNPNSTYSNSGTWRFDMVTVQAAAPIPEPETYVLMLAGLGLVGWMARRRKQV